MRKGSATTPQYGHTKPRTHEAASPAGAFQIGRASGVIREKPLELGKGLREGQIIPLMDIRVWAPCLWPAGQTMLTSKH
jgi:hypothetical protein